MRIELVKYYTDQGRRQLDERFFGGEKEYKAEPRPQNAEMLN